MIRSIFDPSSPDAERGGSQNLGPCALNMSHMPVALLELEGEPSDADSPEDFTYDPADALAATIVETDISPAEALSALFDDEPLSPVGIEPAICPEGAD